jgi:hypothetical protein
MTKAEIRKALEQGMSLFIAGGKQITKCPTYGSKRPKQNKSEEEFVEIEVENLPQALQARFFPEEQ